MNLKDQFKKVITLLKSQNRRYALAGGMVVSLYRKEPRTTNDVDILLWAEDDALKLAKEILNSLGLQPFIIRKAQLEGGPLHAIKRNSTPPFIVAGRVEEKNSIGVDFILPEIPWFQKAFERAQSNKIDFGFGAIPCLTREDVIISKFYSLSNQSDRFKDLDDLQQIFHLKNDLDVSYISAQMRKLKILIPLQIEKLVPDVLRKTSKMIKREFRKK